MRHLVWFRRDLRTADNAALRAACAGASDGVIGAFVISPEEWREHDDAPVKIDFWLRNLRELSGSLARINVPLLIVRSERAASVPALLLEMARTHACGAIHYNHEYEVNEQRRDASVAALFAKHGLTVRAHHDHVVFDPSSIRTGEGRFYTVFTPFKKAFLARAERDGIAPAPAPRRQAETGITPSPVPASVPGFECVADPAAWPAGEKHARARLESFVERRIAAYKDRRDYPADDATSRLSPYLNSGVISPRQCIAAAAAASGGRLDDRRPGMPGPAHWISEIIWREFYQHVLVGYPRVSMHRAFKPATDRIRWERNQEHLDRWKRGLTGVPIVDAAMRQLSATGWMHNRLRMVAAMYLTKDLFLDWREGERHFMRTLIDGDLGSNNGGWQWSASTGTDAAPYFRIFNPVSQSEKFDPDGAFLRRWVPELAPVEGDAVHEPSRLPGLLRARLDYPEPLVDHRAARERVMSAFKQIAAATA